MNALLIDCTLHSIGLGVLKKGQLVEECVIHIKKRKHSPLFDILQKMILRHDLPIRDLDVIGYNAGPGSFTGIRVTLSIAKGLAIPFLTPLIGVSSFDMLNSVAPKNYLYLAIHSRQKFYYLAKRKGKSSWTPIGTVRLKEIDLDQTFLYDGSDPILLSPRTMLPTLKKKWAKKQWDSALSAKPLYIEDFSPIAKSKRVE